MARDPPSLLENSQLRGIPLQPSAVRNAKITIVHPQLRDLILPLERGRVLYPRGQTIEEQRWTPSDDHEDSGGMKSGITGTTRPLFKLDFVPNCLTASRGIFACGGQHGELYICDLPPAPSPNPLTTRFNTSAPKYRPFTIKTTLPGRSINNSIVIPPSWPERWARTADERHLGYAGRGSRGWDEADANSTSLGRTVAGEWVRKKPTGYSHAPSQAIARADSRQPTVEEEEYGGEHMDLSDTDNDGDTEIMSDDDFETRLLEIARSPTSPVATYPNTVPFIHAPRIHVPLGQSGSFSSRHSSSSSLNNRPLPPLLHSGSGRQSFPSRNRYGQPPIQYITSRPHPSHPARTASSSSSTRPSSITSRKNKIGLLSPSQAIPDEPRLLISNNDCTVKLFSLRPVSPDTSRSGENSSNIGSSSSRNPPSGISTSILRHGLSNERDPLVSRPLDRLGLGSTRTGSSSSSFARWGRNGTSSTDTMLYAGPSGSDSLRFAEHQTEILQRELERASDQLREEQENLMRDRADFERIIGMRVGEGIGSLAVPETREQREERRLSKVGGMKFKVATNHSSLSPDLRTMVSVGDSTEINIFEVIEGGREFRKIAVYNAATDAGFSTSWSKDGRKFAVASQDGQVTVWDHRSSQPLAIFYTSANRPDRNSPSFLNDVTASHNRPASPEGIDVGGEWHTVGPNGMILRDPVTGTPRTGRSSSGREAARVVKFSPEGSSRDLMVFSEENSHIHIIDAQTFNTHLLLPVPHNLPFSIPEVEDEENDLRSDRRPRPGVEGGTYGIAGVAFDPTGDWLYSGTEKTVVEWDLRRDGYDGGNGGTWALA